MKKISLLFFIFILMTCQKQSISNNNEAKSFYDKNLSAKVAMSKRADLIKKSVKKIKSYISPISPEQDNIPVDLFDIYENIIMFRNMSKNCEQLFKDTTVFTDTEDMTCLCLIPFFSRNNNFISKIYNDNKRALFSSLNLEDARKLKLDVLLANLLFSYDILFKNHQPSQIFDKYGDKSGELSDDLVLLTQGINSKFFSYPPAYNYDKWVFSFWYRRYLEGNLKVVHQIIQELHQQYFGTKAIMMPKNTVFETKKYVNKPDAEIIIKEYQKQFNVFNATLNVAARALAKEQLRKLK